MTNFHIAKAVPIQALTFASPAVPTWAPGPHTHCAGPEARDLQELMNQLQVLSRTLAVIPKSAPSWIEDVYSLVKREEIDPAIDLLFEKIDDLLVDGHFTACDDILRAIDVSRLDTNLLVAVLSITVAAREHLPYRVRWLERATQRLMELSPDRIEGLLAGLT